MGIKKLFLLVIFFFSVSTSIFAQNQTNPGRIHGPKKTIAVARFQNTSGLNSYLTLGDDFAAQLSDALIQSGRFIVLSRQDLGAVLTEQDLAESGRLAKSLSAQKGKVIPAQILVTGNITEFEENTQGGNQGLSIHGVNIGMGKSDAHIAIIVQIIDSTTGQILDSQRVEGLADASGFSVGYSGSFSIGSSSFRKTPLGKATQIAIDRSVEYISQRLAIIPWQGRVVTVKDGLVYINAGADTGIINGETFIVCRKGEALIDPETGVELGEEKTKIGDIVISEVQPKFSKAKILSNTDQIRPSDLVIKQ
ncbi:MAG: CsgG/HfaB family protein [Candidatus Omnitrophota bacterium]